MIRRTKHGREPRPAAGPALGDGQGALHARLTVAGNGAEERVLTGLELDREGGRAALADDLAVLVDAVALDRDAVLNRGRVVHRDGHRARFGAQRCGVELQRPTGVRRELDRVSAARAQCHRFGGRLRRCAAA